MRHVILSDEFIEKMADIYRNQKLSITFQEFIELELSRVKEAIGLA
ncbi:hypothetical protein [Ammoniphilus oxalaticus]|nr:hypothetical protein [Ammoniphilus oxalaticus]